MQIRPLTKPERAKFNEYVKAMQDAGLEPACNAEQWAINYRAAQARIKQQAAAQAAAK